jgi:hypothetical protein
MTGKEKKAMTRKDKKARAVKAGDRNFDGTAPTLTLTLILVPNLNPKPNPNPNPNSHP